MTASDDHDGGVRGPASPYVAGSGLDRQANRVRAKLFPNGRSQAVRLPKAFRMPGKEVLVHREGNRVILEPVGDPPRDANGWRIGFWEELHAMAAQVDWSDFELPPDPPPPAGEFDHLFGDTP
jgi:antitoxin VapB